MGADVSRDRYNPLDDFAGVKLKQGGVLLDADFNELVEGFDRRFRALASDVLGRSRVSSTTSHAFNITITPPTQFPADLLIGKGRLYVDGLLAENHGASSAVPADKLFDPLLAEVQFFGPIPYSKQPYLPNPPALPPAGRHLVYLDVWQREVTHLERPDLVEIAVGVETSSRLQTVWQVRLWDAGDASCDTPDDDVKDWSEFIAPSTGRLTTGTFEVPPEDDPCELPPSGGYRGLENQTYRVQIHDPGGPDTAATFKWSRNNASVVSRVSSVISPGELELQTLGRDDVLRFNTGDWVEITDDVREFSQHSGEMRQITVDEAARRITFAPLPVDMIPTTLPFPDSLFPRERNLRVLLWDQAHEVLRTGSGGSTSVFQDLDGAGTAGVIEVPAADTTLLLENGVTVRFPSTDPTGYRAGDYWVFAARTPDASVELLENEPPQGIAHHYARLGIWDVGAGTVADCRDPWPPPATEGKDCSCTRCVTAESHNSRKFTIQQAVDQVQKTGGTVCLGSGQYALADPVRVINARSVRIQGQGAATTLASEGGVFLLRNCVAVAIENLAILSLGKQSAISVHTALGMTLQRLVVAVVGTSEAPGAAISLQGVVAAASIRNNAIIAPVAVLANDPAAAQPAGDARKPFLLTAALSIEDNLLWCQREAVTLVSNVQHMMSVRIVGNEVLGCRDTAIQTLGLGLAGCSMTVSRNSLSITGNGIRCGVDGLWIEGNKLVNSAANSLDSARTAGIALATGSSKKGADQCQILANQVSGFSHAGILIGAPTRELIVRMNVIENCGNGIISADNADAGAVSIEGNHLRNIGPHEARAARVVGIGVGRSDSAIIAGNTIRTLGVEMVEAQLCAGILTFGALRVRVSGNEITDVAPAGDFGGPAAGIMLRAPYLEFEVNHNQVQRDAKPSRLSSNGNWIALTTVDGDARSPLVRVGDMATLRIDSARVVVVIDGKRVYLSAPAGLAAPGEAEQADEPARGSVLGNVLTARGIGPAVDVAAAGECLFNDNRVELRGSAGVATVILSTKVAIVNANRVRGPKLSIQLGAPAAAVAVLGNVTTGGIEIQGDKLQAPWAALNVPPPPS